MDDVIRREIEKERVVLRGGVEREWGVQKSKLLY